MTCSYVQVTQVDMWITSWSWVTCKTIRHRCVQSKASLRQIQASNCMRVALPITNYGVHMHRMSNEPHNLYRKNIRTWAVRIVLGRNTMPFCIQYVTLSQISSTQYGLKWIECAMPTYCQIISDLVYLFFPLSVFWTHNAASLVLQNQILAVRSTKDSH